MRKVIIILFMSLYSVGNILLPNVDVTSLRDMYHHCELEDPDLNPLDFVTEHLLNLPDVFEYFEDENEEENERPHQPFHHASSSFSIAVTEPRTIRFECKPASFTQEPTVTYPIFEQHCLPSGYLSQLLRPPIA